MNRPKKPAEWALLRGARVYNDLLIKEAHGEITSAIEWEDTIGMEIEKAYKEGYQRGYMRGRRTLEEELGA